MTSIDWREVFTNAIWIIGCAVALATLSYADWRADQQHEKLRAQFARPKIRVAFDLALVLFCVGLAATSDSTVTVIIWIILIVLSIIQLVHDWRGLRRSAKPDR